MKQEIMTLYEFNLMVKEILMNSLPHTFLITAEIASLNVDSRGHCYLDLIEKVDNTIAARMDGRIWVNQYKSISKDFEETTGKVLSKGLRILIHAQLNFHERYGMSLIIRNIDPSYTLGEMARKRKEIIDRLTLEGLINKNKLLPFPIVPQRLALISSSRAAGYGDFVNHISNNPYGYAINIKLFEAVMQGDNAEASIINALLLCERHREEIDAVIIVRGGGAASELDCFDSYEIGKAIALLSIPVISGIGHERDRTVIDEVSNTSLKTPTAAAGFIIETIRTFDENIDLLSNNLSKGAELKIINAQKILLSASKQLENSAKRIILKNSYRLDNLLNSILGTTKRQIKQNHTNIQKILSLIIDKSKKLTIRHTERLNTLYSAVNHLDPASILKRGFSLTYLNGKAVKTIEQIKIEDKIETKLAKGRIISEVINLIQGD